MQSIVQFLSLFLLSLMSTAFAQSASYQDNPLYTNNTQVFLPTVDDSTATIYQLHPYANVVLVTGSIAAFANFVSTVFVFWRSHVARTQKSSDGTLAPSQRFPIYMAVVDCATAIITLIQLIYAFMNSYLLPSSICTAAGFLTSMLILMNMTLVGLIAIMTWFKICQNQSMPLGPFDSVLWSITIIIPLIVSVVTFVFHGYGADTYWCFAEGYQTGGRIEFIFLVAYNYLILGITTICYVTVIRKLHISDSELALSLSIAKLRGDDDHEKLRSPQISPPTNFSHNTWRSMQNNLQTPRSAPYQTLRTPQSGHFNIDVAPPSPVVRTPQSPYFNSAMNAGLFNNNRVEAARQRTEKSLKYTTSKMSTYIFVHLVQYTPTVIYCLSLLTGYSASWIYVLLIIFINIGSCAKAYAYMRSESKSRISDSANHKETVDLLGNDKRRVVTGQLGHETPINLREFRQQQGVELYEDNWGTGYRENATIAEIRNNLAKQTQYAPSSKYAASADNLENQTQYAPSSKYAASAYNLASQTQYAPSSKYSASADNLARYASSSKYGPGTDAETRSAFNPHSSLADSSVLAPSRPVRMSSFTTVSQVTSPPSILTRSSVSNHSAPVGIAQPVVLNVRELRGSLLHRNKSINTGSASVSASSSAVQTPQPSVPGLGEYFPQPYQLPSNSSSSSGLQPYDEPLRPVSLSERRGSPALPSLRMPGRSDPNYTLAEEPSDD